MDHSQLLETISKPLNFVTYKPCDKATSFYKNDQENFR
jgi:hypothetical protein